MNKEIYARTFLHFQLAVLSLRQCWDHLKALEDALGLVVQLGDIRGSASDCGCGSAGPSEEDFKSFLTSNGITV